MSFIVLLLFSIYFSKIKQLLCFFCIIILTIAFRLKLYVRKKSNYQQTKHILNCYGWNGKINKDSAYKLLFWACNFPFHVTQLLNRCETTTESENLLAQVNQKLTEDEVEKKDLIVVAWVVGESDHEQEHRQHDAHALLGRHHTPPQL